MGRSVPAMGKAAAASQASLALAAMGGALSARALQAVAGVRGSGGAGPGSVGSALAVGDASDAPRGKAGPATGNRPGFASVLARIATTRVSRGQSDARDSVATGFSAQPVAAMSEASDAGAAGDGAVAAPAPVAGRRASMSSVRRDAAAAMRAVGRLARALDRARPADASDGSSPTAGAGMRQPDAAPPTPRASDDAARDGAVRGPDGDRGAPVASPEAAVAAVEDGAARIEAAVATGDAAKVAQAVSNVAATLPDGIRILLGQAAVALAGEAGALDLGMLMVGAFDGTVADLPVLAGTSADQSSLAGLLVALRQVGATLEVGGATVMAVTQAGEGVDLDGAGVFAALASALASAASLDAAPADGAAVAVPTGPAVPAAIEAAPEAVPIASTVIDTPALSDVDGVPVIAVAEAGVATVVPVAAHATGKATSAGAIPGAGAAAPATADASGDTPVGVPPAAVVAQAGASGAGIGDADDGAGQASPGAPRAVQAGSPPVGGGGLVPDPRARDVDAPGIASTSSRTAPEFEVPEQVSPVLIRLARLTGVGEARQFTLRLSPDHLGPLSIRLTLRQGALGVDLTSATPEARKALESALPQLRASLLDAGLRVDRLEVALRDRTDDGSGRNAGRQGDQASQRQPGEPGGQPGSGTGSGGREWAATLSGRLHFDQDGRPFDLPATGGSSAMPAELVTPTREFVRTVGGETSLSVTRALGVQSRLATGIGAYGGRRTLAAVATEVEAG